MLQQQQQIHRIAVDRLKEPLDFMCSETSAAEIIRKLRPDIKLTPTQFLNRCATLRGIPTNIIDPRKLPTFIGFENMAPCLNAYSTPNYPFSCEFTYFQSVDALKNHLKTEHPTTGLPVLVRIEPTNNPKRELHTVPVIGIGMMEDNQPCVRYNETDGKEMCKPDALFAQEWNATNYRAIVCKRK